MLTYTTLKDRPREFLAATSLTPEEFAHLLPAFEAAYNQLYPPTLTGSGQPRQRRPGGGLKGTLSSVADKLLFILVYQKTNPLQTMHGLQFGLSQPQTNYWIHRLLPVLQQALQDLGHAPERDARRIAASPLLEDSPPELALDGTERRRQRPQDPARQRAHYSGKKKTHTDKNIVLVHEPSSQILYLGPTVPGKTHDKKAVDEACIVYPANATLDKDTGFQGYEPPGVVTYQPKKTAPAGAQSRRTAAQPSRRQRADRGGARPRRGQALPHCEGGPSPDEGRHLRSGAGDCLRATQSPRHVSAPAPSVRSPVVACDRLMPIMSNIEGLRTAAGQNLKRLLQKWGWGRRPGPHGEPLGAAVAPSLSLAIR